MATEKTQVDDGSELCEHGKIATTCFDCGRPAGEVVDEWRDVVVEGKHRPLVLFSLDPDNKIWFHTDGTKKMVQDLVRDLVRLLEV